MDIKNCSVLLCLKLKIRRGLSRKVVYPVHLGDLLFDGWDFPLQGTEALLSKYIA